MQMRGIQLMMKVGVTLVPGTTGSEECDKGDVNAHIVTSYVA